MTWDGVEKRMDGVAAAEKAEEILSRAALTAARVVADANNVALKVVADAVALNHSDNALDLGYIKRDIAEIKDKLDNKYITKDQFFPVKMAVYGFMSLVLVSVVGALLAVVIIKP